MKILRFANLFKLVLITVLLAAGYIALQIYKEPYAVKPDPLMTPLLRGTGIDFKHEYMQKASLPVAGAAAFDADNDGGLELFIAGGLRQRDALFKFDEGTPVDITVEAGLLKDFGDSTYGVASVDATGDGLTDLFIARDSGLYLYTNNAEAWQKQKLDISFEAGTAPATISLGDYDKDGDVDLFISTQLKPSALLERPKFNNSLYGAAVKLLRNNGDNHFEDVTAQSGLANLRYTNTGVFADLNADGWVDLVVAHHVNGVLIYQNQGGRKFVKKTHGSSSDLAFALGLAVGDYNNDGRLDILATNVGTSIPAALFKGQLQAGQHLNTDWQLLRNEGNFEFTDVAAEHSVARYELARGAVFADINLDTLPDLVVSSNHIAYPAHHVYKNPGKLLLQNSQGQFASVEESARIENKQFGVAPVVADFNNDGNLDIAHINLNAAPALYINEVSVRRYLMVDVGNDVHALGAQVMLETPDGTKQYRTVISGEGLATDQPHIIHFGLGSETEVNKVVIRYLSGRVVTVKKPGVNTTIKVAELSKNNEPVDEMTVEETVNDQWLIENPEQELETQAAEAPREEAAPQIEEEPTKEL